jgi:hypothetical protein
VGNGQSISRAGKACQPLRPSMRARDAWGYLRVSSCPGASRSTRPIWSGTSRSAGPWILPEPWPSIASVAKGRSLRYPDPSQPSHRGLVTYPVMETPRTTRRSHGIDRVAWFSRWSWSQSIAAQWSHKPYFGSFTRLNTARPVKYWRMNVGRLLRGRLGGSSCTVPSTERTAYLHRVVRYFTNPT